MNRVEAEMATICLRLCYIKLLQLGVVCVVLPELPNGRYSCMFGSSEVASDRAFWMSDYYAMLLHLMTNRASIVASLKIHDSYSTGPVVFH